MGVNCCKEETETKVSSQEMIKKIVEGVAILNIHQIRKENSLDLILNKQELKKEIILSFCRKQTEKCIQCFPDLDKAKISFKHFEIVKKEIPYLVIFTMQIITCKENKIFTECRLEDKYEIFDLSKKLGEINVIVGYWNPQPTENKTHYQQVNIQNEMESDCDNKTNSAGGTGSGSGSGGGSEGNTTNKILEITPDYFIDNFRYIMNISQGYFGVVSLQFDIKKKKIFAVKRLKNLHSQEDGTSLESQIKEEVSRVVQAIRRCDLPPEKRFNDKQDEGIQGLNRNIVREIMITHNRKKSDRINNLEGVVYCAKESRFMLIFEFFGGCEYGQEHPTCDLFRYIQTNKDYIFNPMSQKERKQFITDVMRQILEGVKHLYEEDNIYDNVSKKKPENQEPLILIRDLNQANILIRRDFTKTPKKSKFEILLIDFGMAKVTHSQPTQETANNQNLKNLNLSLFKTYNSNPDSPCQDNLSDVSSNNSALAANISVQQNQSKIPINRNTSIAIQACTPGRFPKYLFDEFQKYTLQDDIFAIAAIYYALLTQLDVKIDEKIKQNLQIISGIPYEKFSKYSYIMANYFSEACIQRARNLFENKLEITLEYQKKIPSLDFVIQYFNDSNFQEQ